MGHMAQPTNPTEIFRVRIMRTWHDARSEFKRTEYVRHYWTRSGAETSGTGYNFDLADLGKWLPEKNGRGHTRTVIERAEIGGWTRCDSH